jgi:hypothetical protein|tara:strand:- start:135 stop:476 length:342 start_codon:yes stop_codon:yes gene_type:complete
MPITFYSIVHIVSVILLAGITFSAIASPQPERRKNMLMGSGIVAMVVLITGFGALARLGLPFQGWVAIKVLCWLVLAMATPMAFRRSEQAGLWRAVTFGAILIAVLMVQLRPF